MLSEHGQNVYKCKKFLAASQGIFWTFTSSTGIFFHNMTCFVMQLGSVASSGAYQTATTQSGSKRKLPGMQGHSNKEKRKQKQITKGGE